MRISTKLKLGSLAILALLVLNAAVTVFLIHRMMENVQQLAEVEDIDRIQDDEIQTVIHEQIQRAAMGSDSIRNPFVKKLSALASSVPKNPWRDWTVGLRLKQGMDRAVRSHCAPP